MEKQKSQRYHGKYRLLERFALTEEDYKILVKATRDNDFPTTIFLDHQFVEAQSRTRTRHYVDYRGRKMEYIYDKSRHQIVTFLYPDNKE